MAHSDRAEAAQAADAGDARRGGGEAGYGPMRVSAARWAPYPQGSKMNSWGYPRNPGSKPCSTYLASGTCKWSADCWYDHPEDSELNGTAPGVKAGAPDCHSWIRNGACSFGPLCKYNHPEAPATDNADYDLLPNSAPKRVAPPAHAPAKPLVIQLPGKLPAAHAQVKLPAVPVQVKLPAARAPVTMPAAKAPVKLLVPRVAGVLPAAHTTEPMQMPSFDDFEEDTLNDDGLPLRPGEPLCAFFMKTGSCRFGPSCKFDHPRGKGGAGTKSDMWLNDEGLPIRKGEEPCSFYLKTGTCKFGPSCRFDHSASSKGGSGGNTAAKAEPLNEVGLPMRPDEEPCAFFMKTGTCKYGANCRYDHPAGVSEKLQGKDPNPDLNESGLPMRPGEQQCTFYLRSGTCKFGANCRFDHPPGMGGIGNLPGMGDGAPLNDAGMPMRPGREPCAFFLKTGNCQFGPSCRFDHPQGLAGAGGVGGVAHGLELNEQGLPMRPGAEPCSFFAKAGTCKFGLSCKFDHPSARRGKEAGLGGVRGRRPPSQPFR